MKKILVIGATGGTGLQVVSQALRQGHQVTAFVRTRARLNVRDDRLQVSTGTLPDDREALATAVRRQDAVISALGVGSSLKSGDLIARSMPVIVSTLEREGVRRLIFTSAYGVGSTYRDVPLLPRIAIRLLLGDLYRDKEKGEVLLQRSGLDWTLVYPVTLSNGPATARYRAGERLGFRGFPRISRADLATFLLSQLDDKTYLRKGVLVGP